MPHRAPFIACCTFLQFLTLGMVKNNCYNDVCVANIEAFIVVEVKSKASKNVGNIDVYFK